MQTVRFIKGASIIILCLFMAIVMGVLKAYMPNEVIGVLFIGYIIIPAIGLWLWSIFLPNDKNPKDE